MKVTGVPYEEISRSGGGIAASARALAETDDAGVLAQARAIRRRDARPRHDGVRGQDGLRPLARRRAALAAAGAGARARLGDRAVRPRGAARRSRADAWMDEVDDLAAGAAIDALDIYVESVAFSNDHLARLGEIAHREGVPLRAHVEQFNANRSVPVALAAGARSVDHLALPAPGRPRAAGRGRVRAPCCCPAPSSSAPRRWRPGRALADAGAICVLATDCNPGTSPVLSLPVVIGLAVRRYGWTALEALAAVHAQRGLGARAGGARRARSRSASAPTCSCSTGRSSTSRTASGATPCRGGESRTPASVVRLVIAADDLERRLADLVPIGRDEAGATTRLAWTEEDEAAAGWFARRAAELGPPDGARPGRQPVGLPGGARAVVGGRLAPRHRARRRALRRRARRGGGVRGRRALAPCRSRSSRSPTRRARASTRRRSAAAR